MGPALLRFADPVQGPAIKSVPDWSEDFVQIRDAIRPAPPGRIPRNAVNLVDHQIEFWLGAIPTSRGENRRAFVTAAQNADAFYFCFLRARAGKIIGEPKHF